MKICFLVNTETMHSRRWVDFFVKRKHEVSVITHADYDIPGAKTYRLVSPMKKDIQNRFMLKILGFVFGKVWTAKFFTFAVNFIFGFFQTPGLIHKIKPDIIHAHFLASYGIYGAHSRFHPMVVTPWGTDVLVIPKKFLFSRPILKNVLKKADLITYDGLNTKDACIKLGADEKKTRLVYFGVNIKDFNPSKKSAAIRKNIAPKNEVIILYNRGLDALYNLELLFHAIPLVVKKTPNIKLSISGRGPRLDFYKQLSVSLKIEKYIHFAGWFPLEDVSKIVASSDIYVSTSRSDSGLASSTSEAMACGLPVIVTDTGGTTAWIKDNRNGYIVPMDDPEYLAEKISMLVANKELRKKFGKANRKFVVENQDYNAEMGKMEKIYSDLIAPKRK